MLQVTENGAIITLSGKSGGPVNGLYWFGVALLIGAIGVAMAMSLLPERLAIGALALLIIGSFFFNKLRSKQAEGKDLTISAGILKVQKGMFVHNLMGKRDQIYIQPGDVFSLTDTSMVIAKADGSIRCQIIGFESAKEAQVMQAILQGQQFGKRNANIRMQSN